MMRLVVIGAGPGGYETAAEAAKRGFDVVLVSAGPLGGTCLNEGCIPTKSLIHSVSEGSAMSLQEAVSHKSEVVSQLQAGITMLLKKVKVVFGKARFVDVHTVAVDGEDGQAQEFAADKVIIATGSVGAVLPVPGAELAIGSKEILDLVEVPASLAIIGGGVIGLEFAGIFRSLGTEVTVLEYCPGILPRFDVDAAKRLKQSLVRSGINIVTSAQVTGIVKEDDGLSVQYNLKDEQKSVKAQKVLMAVGRRANVDSLNLADIGIDFDRRGIKVDQQMRTNVPDIYAVGDVTGGIMLAHVATYQGLRALNDICGIQDSINFSAVPAVVFTNPELATVGLTEEDCEARGIAFKSLKSFYRANGKAVASGQGDGYCKVLVGESDGKILGCHMLGAHASDIIQEAAALISLGATLEQARWIIHPHPTLCEVLQSALHSA